jgi:hypothetical protein
MTEMARLELRYRRLLAWYPRAYRRENEQEILTVLMAGARNGQRRPGLAESTNLMTNGLWNRLRPSASRPRTVTRAIRLMYLGAALELAALITIATTNGDVRSAIESRHPDFTAAKWQLVHEWLVAKQVAVAVAIGVWLILAWASGRGRDWARISFVVFFALVTLSLLSSLSQGAAIYASADLAAGTVIWLVQVAVLVLIFNSESTRFYRPSLAGT